MQKYVYENEQSAFRDSSYCELVWYSSDCETPKCMSVVHGAICRQLIEMLFARMSRTLFTTSYIRPHKLVVRAAQYHII